MRLPARRPDTGIHCADQNEKKTINTQPTGSDQLAQTHTRYTCRYHHHEHGFFGTCFLLDQSSECIPPMVMLTPAPVAGQERPGEHREPPRRHEDDDGGARGAGARMPDLGGELGHLPRDPAPPELLGMEQAGGRRNRLTVQRHRQPPPPGPRGGRVVPALQPLVLEQAAATATAATTDAGVLEEAHHGSFTAKSAMQEI